MTEFFILLFKTVALRPYVFVFLAAFLFCGRRLLGWPRTLFFFFNTWLTALLCELSSTRTGIPFGWYFYNGSTIGDELYLWDVPFMDSLSFTFLLFASYALALWFLLPSYSNADAPASAPRSPSLQFDGTIRRAWPTMLLTAFLFALLDVVIDPVALRGDRWFLGKIYFYPDGGVHFGVPLANYVGWAVVGLISLSIYRLIDRQLPEQSLGTSPDRTTTDILLACGLYYGVLLFNLTMTFWIGERLLGLTDVLIYLPITGLFLLRAFGRLAPSSPPQA
ncbi:MAG: carotenoid biosynthesis protein [Nitrospiraceae bacterium]